MRMLLFANRNAKEVLRDPVNIFFGLGFPLVLLALLTIVNNAIPPEANNVTFEIENLAPGLAMFGSTFMALFSGMILATDRTSSFLIRLFTSPMTASDFLLGYTTPMFIMTAVQSAITLSVAAIIGLSFSINLLLATLMTAFTSLLFIGIGLLAGSLMSDKAVSGLCGALLTNIAGWLSGIFIPIDLLGDTFKTVTNMLPFRHSVEAIQAVLYGNYGEAFPHVAVVSGYTVVVFIFALIAFRRRMRGEKA